LVWKSRYSLSREDEIRCRAVDALLSHTDWANEKGSSMNTQWQSIIREQKNEVRIAAAVEKAVADLTAKGIDPFAADP
jgi:transaldolase